MRSPKKKVLFNSVVLIAVAAICFLLLASQQSCASQVRSRRVGNANELTLDAQGDLQSAIKAARFGDTIVLQAGATYEGPLVLPDKGVGNGTDADYITIRTSDLLGIARENERVSPAQSRSMAKIVSPNKQSAISTQPLAHHYRFVGIEFSPAADAGYVYNLMDLGSSGYNSTLQFSHHLVFVGCYVHLIGLNNVR